MINYFGVNKRGDGPLARSLCYEHPDKQEVTNEYTGNLKKYRSG